jgi:recombination protein RecA
MLARSFALQTLPAIDQVLMAADLLQQSGGFGLVVLDLGSLEPWDTVKIPLTTWFLLCRAVDETRTLLLVLKQEPHAGSSAAVVLDLAQAG